MRNFSLPLCVAGRGVCGAVWFGFEGKNLPNRKIKKHAVWFGSVDFKNKIRTKPNQGGLGWIGWCGFFRDDTIFSNIKIKLKSGNTTYFQQCFKFHQILNFHFHFPMFSTTYTKLKTLTKLNPIL